MEHGSSPPVTRTYRIRALHSPPPQTGHSFGYSTVIFSWIRSLRFPDKPSYFFSRFLQRERYCYSILLIRPLQVENNGLFCQMCSEHWISKWNSGVTPWVKEEPNEWLWKYLHLLKTKDFDTGDIFLVPCCGKKGDMATLYKMGYRVVGVELYEKAVVAFFHEQNLEYVKKCNDSLEGGYIEYSTPDGLLRILVADFLTLTPEVIGAPVKMVWDRGSLTSIDKTLRKGYVKTMLSLLDKKVGYLLDCFHYKEWFSNSAPRNLSRELIDHFFGESFKIQFLEKEEENWPHLQDKEVYRNLYFLSKAD